VTLASIAWTLLATWAVFVVLHGLLNARTGLWAVPEMVPPLVFAVVPLVLAAFVVPVTAGRDRPWAALFVLALLGAGMPWNGVALPTAGRKGGNEGAPLVVFVWNTEFWDEGKDVGSFFGFLRSQAADVYLLQEFVHTEGRRAAPATGTDDLAVVFPDHEVLVQEELVTVIHRRLRPQLMPGLPEIVLRTDIVVGHTTMALYNVHMPVPLDLRYTPLRAPFYRFVREQAAERKQAFRALGDLLRDAPPAMVMGGDFNSSSAMRTMRRLRSRYADPMRSAGRLYVATWPARPHRLWRLDWVLTSRQVTTEWARAVDPGGLSDHFGQLCALRPAPLPAHAVPPAVSAPRRNNIPHREKGRAS
jgi:endonuclease/exonuclease/phosphatase (EEP) superfamily protein YafD